MKPHNPLFPHGFLRALIPSRSTVRGAALALTALTAACATSAPRAASTTPSPNPAAMDRTFQDFIRDFRATALSRGITADTYDTAMAGLRPNARIQELNEKQPEFAKQIWDYLDGAVSPQRVANGQQALAANATALANIESRYGVPKEILTAIWGLETAYGANIGGFNMFEALATLSYDGPRQSYAREQLIGALKMMQDDRYPRSEMVSSWAGAFGQTQFIPTTFFKYGVDGDGDGKIDLWRSVPDALASTANLLDAEGWKRGQDWGYEITLPANFDYASAELDQTKPVSQWRAMGVKTAFGAPLPDSPDNAAIFVPAGARGPAFLLFDNFKVILRYNNSSAYALGVSYLASRIGGGASIVASWPREEMPMSKDQRMQFQTDLKALGFDPGPIDGLIGKQVRAALRGWQSAHGMKPDGFATLDILARMNSELAAKSN